MVLPAKVPGIAVGSQERDLDAVDCHRAVCFIQVLNNGRSLISVKEHVQAAIGGIPFNVMGDIAQGSAGLPADIDHQFIKKPSSHMMPDGQLADSPQAVDSKLYRIFCFCFRFHEPPIKNIYMDMRN